MGLNKAYDGYRSYAYLAAGSDYRDFEFPSPPDRWSEGYTVPVSEAEEARVQKILRENVVISLHDHPIIIPTQVSELLEVNRLGRSFTAYEALSRSGLDCIFDNLLDGMATITSKSGWKWQDVLFDLGMRLCDASHQSFLVRCQGLADIYRCFEEGKLAWVPCLESATMIENELDRLDILYGFGIRSMGLVYNESNALGSGLMEKRDGGLTAFGRRAIRRMNQLGILIDLSHASDQTCLQAVEASELPIVISHAGAQALWPSRRLKPDCVLLAVAEKGGLVGIEAAPHTTITRQHRRHSLDTVMEHFEYCVRLLGIDYVTFGPDTIYGDHVGLHREYARQLAVSEVQGALPEEEKVPYVPGAENPSEFFPNAVRWLVVHGYSDEDIAKVIGKNTLRVLEKTWWKS